MVTEKKVKPLRLDLGCGLKVKKGFVGVDLYVGPKKIDLFEFPWPWEDNSVDEINCEHFIEHMPRGLWVPFVDEMHRIMKPGAKATIVHPNLKSVRAFQDPTHQDFIPAERWYYANKDWRVNNGLDHPPYPTCNFDFDIGACFGPGWEHRTPEAAMQAATVSWDVVLDLQVVLTKKE